MKERSDFSSALVKVTVKTPLLIVCVTAGVVLFIAVVALVLVAVGDCGDSMCSGVRLPSEPSLESEEGGVNGKPPAYKLFDAWQPLADDIEFAVLVNVEVALQAVELIMLCRLNPVNALLVGKELVVSDELVEMFKYLGSMVAPVRPLILLVTVFNEMAG
uniref:Uncharacterized protein n=1 Tax=Glossina austeni TaxID=7395 RepID=A0A1A9VKW0_GLOAU